MVAAHNHRQRSGRKNVRDALRDLIVPLGDVGRTPDVAHVAHLERFAQVHAELEIVGGVKRRDAPDALRAEAGAGAVGGADIERRADEGYIVLADLAHILEIRRLEESVNAGPVRQLAALEATDLGLVLNRVDAFETEFFSAANFLLPLPQGNAPFVFERPHSFQIG